MALFAFASLAAVTLLLGLRSQVGRAIARRIEGNSALPDAEARVAALEERVQELESMQLRMAELEDRVDFAERLLSQTREAERVEPGRSLH
ncbi:MAG: hypothetical protein H0U85_04655 [Gemmatimonadales bacterium]|nr:hypothetical protein [Gemmatimonadales bacterium]